MRHRYLAAFALLFCALLAMPAGSQVNSGRGGYTDRSGSIAAGGTFVSVAAANAARNCFFIQNPSTATQQNIAAAETLFIRSDGQATVNGASSIELKPGDYWFDNGPFVNTQGWTAVGATTNHRFVAKECV